METPDGIEVFVNEHRPTIPKGWEFYSLRLTPPEGKWVVEEWRSNPPLTLNVEVTSKREVSGGWERHAYLVWDPTQWEFVGQTDRGDYVHVLASHSFAWERR